MLRSIRFMLVACLLLTACSAPMAAPAAGSTAAPTRLKVCYSSLNATMSPAMYASQMGVFARHGLDVEFIYIDSGTKATTALIAGDIDICQVAGSAVINAVVAGAPIRLIGGLFNTYVYSLMVSPEIQTPEDLVGKAVAISQPGAASDFAIRVALTGLGLEPDTEVAVLAVGGQSERLAATLTGRVAGTLVSVPETIKAREAGLHELLDMSALNAPYQHTAIAVRDSLLARDRDAALRFMKAIGEAIALMKIDREGTMAVMAHYMLLDLDADRAALSEAYDILVLRYLETVPYPTMPGIQSALDELVADNPQAANTKPEQVADVSLVRELEQQGYFSALAVTLTPVP
jgi:NitT/TauT family transport system substrate-binding protein